MLGQQQLQQQLFGVGLLGLEERLRIADRFVLIPTAAGECRLYSPMGSLVLKSQGENLLESLVAALDGERTVGDILAALGAFDPHAVRATLQSLLDGRVLERVDNNGAGLLDPEEGRRFRSQIAFFSHFVLPPDTVPAVSPVGPTPRDGVEYQERLKRARVGVFGAGRLGSQLARSLATAGIGHMTVVDSQMLDADALTGDGCFGTADPGNPHADAVGAVCTALNPALKLRIAAEPRDEAELSSLLSDCAVAVLCPDHVNPAEYETFNRAALRTRTLWTSARFAGFEFHIGPTVIPGETPCYECFRQRINSNVADFAEHTLVEEHMKHHRRREASLVITPAAGLLALEVVKAVTWFAPPASYGHLFSLNLLTMQSGLHPVLKIPRCTACGRPSLPRPTIHAWQQTRTDPCAS
jgi:bacteriocin biosynthesis cyclodehydratase domain-containing protein